MTATAGLVPRRRLGRTPSRDVVVAAVLAAGAWATLLAIGHRGSGAHHGHHAAGPSPISAGHAAAMVVAMMVPGCVPMLVHVRHRALRRRWWAAPTVLTAYLAVWVAAALVAVAVSPAGWSRPAVAGALAVAASWQLTPAKRWAAASCDRPVRLALRGRAATSSELRFGLHQGGACVASCGLTMVPMLVGGGPIVALMAVGTLVPTMERLSRRPAVAQRLGALTLAVAALLVVV